MQVSLLVSCCFCASAQNVSEKLAPVHIIGTATSVDYANNIPSSTVNTLAHAFDGNYQTYLATWNRSGGWAGLDLGEKHVITKVAFSPRENYDKRLVLGVFEGANNPDFGDAVPLLLITETPGYNTMTEKAVTCSRGFRYVRYVGPNDVRCNIAELAFYGYKGEGDNSVVPPLTNLPSVVIHTANAENIVEKEKYIPGIVSFISADGKNVYTDSLDIKGRGNASWNFEKKPYRLKLRNKASVLGNPAKEKNWTLINNYGDKTLMRNLLGFDLSNRLELPYTPAGQPVNVFLNGEYKGCYQLCDQIEVADKRVEVTKMKAADTSGDNLTGGYLIEIDAYASQEPATSMFTSFRYSIPVTIKYPKDDEIVPAQHTYIKSHFEDFLMTLQSTNYTDPATGFRKFLDTQTFIRHFLVGELSGNTDTYWSVYMYKDRLSNQFLTGPVWDFDIAFDNDRRTYPVNLISDWICLSSKSSCAGDARSMVRRILSDPLFLKELKETYAYYRDHGILSAEALTQVIDGYEEELGQSQQLNFTRWNIMNTKVHENPVIHGSYAAEVANVRSYLQSRIAWMDRKLEYQPTGNDASLFPTVAVSAYADRIEITGLPQGARAQIVTLSGQLAATLSGEGNHSIPAAKGLYVVQLHHPQEGEKTVKCIVY